MLKLYIRSLKHFSVPETALISFNGHSEPLLRFRFSNTHQSQSKTSTCSQDISPFVCPFSL